MINHGINIGPSNNSQTTPDTTLAIGLGVGLGGVILLLIIVLVILKKKTAAKYTMSVDLSPNSIEMSVRNSIEYTPIQVHDPLEYFHRSFK